MAKYGFRQSFYTIGRPFIVRAHAAPGKAERQQLAAPSSEIRKRRRWESNPLKPGCSRSPGRLAPASNRMPSPGVEPGPRPSQSRMRIRHTPRTWSSSDAPPGNRTRSCGFERRRAPGTPAGERLNHCPRQESNLVHNLRTVVCDPAHPKGRSLEIDVRSYHYVRGHRRDWLRAVSRRARSAHRAPPMKKGAETHLLASSRFNVWRLNNRHNRTVTTCDYVLGYV
jgi:hypothetical protein